MRRRVPAPSGRRRLLGALLLAALTLVTLDLQAPGGLPAWLRRGGEAALSPLLLAGAGLSGRAAVTWADLRRLGDDGARVRQLEAENARLRGQLRATADAAARAAELDRLLGVAASGAWPVVPARVVAHAPAQGFTRTVTIDAGRLDGVRPDSTVLAGGGLVGRVVAVGERTATVLLAVDAYSAVGARLVGSREVGVARGDGSALTLDLLDAGAAASALAVGDEVVTFGSQGGAPYVAGVPVGEVVTVAGAGSGVEGRRATVRPFVDPTRLDLVGVVVDQPRTSPRRPRP